VLLALGVAAGLYALLDWLVAVPADALAKAQYVGRQTCAECHAREVAEFEGSHHDRAMELATPESVRGNFDNQTFERLGVTTRFFRQGDKYMVNTEGPDGEYRDFEVKYTFGYEPLQQYMVEFTDGRVQVLRESWDTEKQAWFYVPPPDAVDVRLPPDDPTHWTGIGQNWNSTCAECHSTNVEKNYDLATDSYHTTFSEIDVSCEACHGPASLHVELARGNSLIWDRRFGYGLHPLKSVSNRREIETCAQCHARQVTRLADGFRPGEPVDDYYQMALLEEGLYHADGQLQDEVFEYGSFLQSKMHSMGVRCSDCHNPHSAKLKFEGNALCAQCHTPARYDTPAHHHHPMGTPGSSCVECHMPATHYMVVDPRRDHSLRIPRPDLSVEIGTPNACNKCHTRPEESPQWAADAIVRWYGPSRRGDPHWGPAIAAGRERKPEGEELLIGLLKRQQTPAIVKATAVTLVAQYPSARAREAVEQALRSDEAMIRQAAVSVYAIDSYGLEQHLHPRLADTSRGVRIAAARRLANVPLQMLMFDNLRGYNGALVEYEAQLRLHAERPDSHMALAELALQQGATGKAEQELRTALRLAPYRSGVRSQLALLLADRGGHDSEVEELRRQEVELYQRDIDMLPDMAAPRAQLGVLHFYMRQWDQAESRLSEAVELAPDNLDYLLALVEVQMASYQANRNEELFRRTLVSLERLHKLDPTNPDVATMLQQLRAMRSAAPAPSPPE
jgi:predicted CXXCH cytochrome family protein